MKYRFCLGVLAAFHAPALLFVLNSQVGLPDALVGYAWFFGFFFAPFFQLVGFAILAAVIVLSPSMRKRRGVWFIAAVGVALLFYWLALVSSIR